MITALNLLVLVCHCDDVVVEPLLGGRIPQPRFETSQCREFMRTTEEVLHCATKIEPTPLDMLASSNGSLRGGVSHGPVPENSLSKLLPILVDRAESDPCYYTVLKQHGLL